MSDEVMEPLTDTMLKRKSSKRSNNDSRDNIDSSSQQKLPSKAPDKKKGFLSKIGKSKGDQQKKRTSKLDPTANSIRNPSSQLELSDTPNEKKPGDMSPRVQLGSYEDSNDSDFLLDNPSSPGAQLPAAKRSQPEPHPDTVYPVFPLSVSSPALQPPFQNETGEETNPVLSGKSPWCPPAPPTCPVDPASGISHSWEPYRSSPLSHTALNSYDSQTATHKNISTIFSSEKMFPDLNCDLEKKIPSDVSNSIQTNEPPNEFTSHKRSDSIGNTQPFKDPSIITESEFISFSSFFTKLNPQDGLLFGDQARNFFLRSELPNEELSKIWMLSDIDGDLKLTFTEFCIAMKLVRNRKKGIPLSSEIPLCMFNSLSLLTDSPDTQLDLQADPPSYSSHLLPQYSDLPEEQTPTASNPCEEFPQDTPTIEDLPSSIQQNTHDSTDAEDLEETVTIENYQIQDEIEDPIPKLSNSSGPTNYTDQIKTLFTPTPNPLPPPPTKTQMQQRSVLTPILSSYEMVQPSPRVEVTPVVQMRSHTTDSSTCPARKKDSCSGYVEGCEDPMILSLPSRGGTDPRDMKNKKKIPRKRPDRVSAVILLDKSDNEESLVSLINNGEIRTIQLTPQKGDEEKQFYDDLSQLSTTDNDVANEPEKANSSELTPHSSPGSNRVKPVNQKKDSKMNILKNKLMKRNKKVAGSNVSLEKADAQETGSRKKSKSKKLSKKDKKKHQRSNSLDVNTHPRLYGSQNAINLSRQEDTQAPTTALTELCRLYSPHKASSTLSLSPTHNQGKFQPQNEYDSFDSTGSSDNVQSDDLVESVPRLRTKKKRIARADRSLSSPECIMSTPPIPEASSDRNDNTFTTPEINLDDNETPLHQSDTYPTSCEREMVTQRIHEMIAKCESLKSVNNQLISELNQIRLQKNELAMQLRYHGPRNFL